MKLVTEHESVVRYTTQTALHHTIMYSVHSTDYSPLCPCVTEKLHAKVVRLGYDGLRCEVPCGQACNEFFGSHGYRGQS